MDIRYVVLDFDGTFTLVDDIAEEFVAAYGRRLGEVLGVELGGLWSETVARLVHGSPEQGWEMQAGIFSAPVAADPYILCHRAAQVVLNALGRLAPPEVAGLYGELYPKVQAKWRPEARMVLETLLALPLERVAFVSNAGSDKLKARLQTLFGGAIPERLLVYGNAGKFNIIQATPPQNSVARARWRAYMALDQRRSVYGLNRPVLLGRGNYFDRLSEIWGEDPDGPAQTIVCGDIFELDLALPIALGCSAHLIARGGRFQTAAYERMAMAVLEDRGGISKDLHGLLRRFKP